MASIIKINSTVPTGYANIYLFNNQIFKRVIGTYSLYMSKTKSYKMLIFFALEFINNILLLLLNYKSTFYIIINEVLIHIETFQPNCEGKCSRS
jgi:hypothetical protein